MEEESYLAQVEFRRFFYSLVSAPGMRISIPRLANDVVLIGHPALVLLAAHTKLVESQFCRNHHISEVHIDEIISDITSRHISLCGLQQYNKGKVQQICNVSIL